MAVVEAQIQTVEDIYRLVWTAVANKRCMSAIYKDLPRLFCPHRLGRNQTGALRVLCYQYGGESGSGLAPIGSPAKLALHRVGETPSRGIRGRLLEDRAESFPSGHLRRGSRH